MFVSRIELVGTENLLSSTLLLPYNSTGFPEISLGTINNILETLIASGSSFIGNPEREEEEELTFTYLTSITSGQGFDTILFLKDEKTLLGYVYLGRVYGNTYSYRGITYLVDKVNITISGQSNSLIVGDEQEVKFNMEITRQKPRTDNVRIKPKEYSGVGNYGIYLRDFLAGNKKDIITDTGYVSFEGGYSGRLHFNQIKLPEAYSTFQHTQVGFYKGDPSLYVWNDEGQYSIFSLTKEIEFVPGVSITKTYTPAIPGISSSEIYTILRGNIRYFASQYCVVEYNEDLYILDTSRQLTPEGGWLVLKKEKIEDSFLYYRYSPTGWIPTTPVDNVPTFDSLDIAVGDVVRIPEYTITYLNDFVVDQSLETKISVIGAYGWKNYEEALKGIGTLSDTEVDSKALVESGYTVSRKVGNWFVFNTPTSTTRLWSNMIQTVEFSKEEEPIVVNDEVLLSYQDGEYTLYDLPGKYRSKKVGEKEGYQLSKKVCKSFESPIDIQKSFFGAFRRNVLPTDVNDFKIVGALGGIIFYKTKNKISYL